ncbi:MAG: hypothetical protein M3Q23_17650 [Actinomycetota bacterium]|nr:hypothetical protein [Actinomycetota bacterium]
MPTAGSSTTPAAVTYGRQNRARLIRRIYLGLLGAFLVLGLLNVFGSRTGSVSAQANGYSLRVVYPQASRPSLPVKWELTLTHPGGFSGPVRVGIPIDYFNLFDFNNTYPLPSDTLNEGGLVIMVFPAPAGDTLEVLLDARTQPGLRAGMSTSTSILGNDDRALVTVRYTTRVMP